MGKSYNIKKGQDDYNKRFSKKELEQMSTYKLKNICQKYKIVNSYKQFNKREKLINIILRYRGIKEADLITKSTTGGIERLEKVLADNLNKRLVDGDEIKIPAKITIYQEIGIGREDMYQVEAKNDVTESNVLLVDGHNNLYGIFNLKKEQKGNNQYYLVAKKENLKLEERKNKNYNLLFFEQKDSDYLYKAYYSKEELPPKNLKYYKLPIINLQVKSLEETDTVLCVDFGTSNTTGGAYLARNYIPDIPNNDILNQRIKVEAINFVKFPRTGVNYQDSLEIIPTIVYVEDCKDPENINYLFGHKAKARMKENDYSSNASVFQGIKKWVSTYQKKEEICDQAGNITILTRGEIIKAYIKYIIRKAEEQFKCKFKKIHISSPVKLKAQFIKMFQEIISEYEVIADDALDEGISVLYNTIANLISKKKYQNNRRYKALVIDCGGGTTDLSSCEFKINKGAISYQVEIRTGFENGDTNFGGNNITYRIMQFMKIVFANYYRNNGKIVDIDSLISTPSANIFRKIDREGLASIYKKLEEQYKEADKIIPTRYKEYENKMAGEYQKVKNNFYFLWEIAENMKKDFFKKTNILRNKFDTANSNSNATDLQITNLNNWGISVYDKQGMLKVIERFPEIVFNIKEINKLIKGDIYEIVRKFLEELYENRELMKYSIIKLTGQSCKIDIFKEALKEFVPGRSIEFKKQKNDSLALKLSCLEGVIKYMKAKKVGDIEVNIENQPPVMPYFITAFLFTGEEKVLIDNQNQIDQAQGNISKPLATSEVKFYLKDEDRNLKQEYIYKNDFSEYKEIVFKEIEKKYGVKITQQETDKIRNKESKFFLFTADNSWGFIVVPVARLEDQLYLGREEYFSFEDDLSKLDFFDGLK